MARVTPRLIALEVDGEDRSDEISKAFVNSAKAERDFMSFTEARGAGARDYVLAMTIVQDHASDTLWDLIWTGSGTEVAGVYAPYGNEVPTEPQPHYEITAVVSEPEGTLMGAEATDSASAVASIDVEWQLTGKPVKITAAP